MSHPWVTRKDLPTADVLYLSALKSRTTVHIDSGSDRDSLQWPSPLIDTKDLLNQNGRRSVVVHSRIPNMTHICAPKIIAMR